MNKKNYLLIIIVLVILAILLLSTNPSPINRQKVNMDYATCEVPDGYRITNTTNHSVTIKDYDKNHVITIYEPVNATDMETALTLFEDKVKDNVNVSQEDYNYGNNITGNKTTTQKLDKDNNITTTTRYWFTNKNQIYYAQTKNTPSHVEKDINFIVNSIEK